MLSVNAYLNLKIRQKFCTVCRVGQEVVGCNDLSCGVFGCDQPSPAESRALVISPHPGSLPGWRNR